MDQRLIKIECQYGANPVEVFNEKFHSLHICKGSKNFEPVKDSKDIQTATGDPAFEFKDPQYECLTDELGYEAGATHSPFKLLTMLRYGGNYRAAEVFVEMEYMYKQVPYPRIGTKYFKRIKKTNQWGIECKQLKVWKKETIKDDHGKGFLKFCPHYDDFTIEPNNKNYQQAIGRKWNLYQPFPHEPYQPDEYDPSGGAVTIDDIPVTANFMAHVFGDQLELGWKYMKVLYERPKQILPVLVLVSKERETGKTSFLNWLDIIFADNYTVLPPSDLDSQFNSQYAYKNIIGVDEAVVDKKKAIEKIKSIATAKTILVNEKMIAQYRIPFYGKIVMTTNKENDFMRVDNEEIRFWVRKLGRIPSEEMTADFYDKLIAEVPKLLRYLKDSVEVEYGRSRMVFTYDEIHNDYIAKVKEESRSGLHKDIEIYVREWFTDNPTKDELFMQLVDIKKQWFPHDSRISPNYIKKVLTQEMGMEALPSARFSIMGSEIKKNARPYCFNREQFTGGDDENVTGNGPVTLKDAPF